MHLPGTGGAGGSDRYADQRHLSTAKVTSSQSSHAEVVHARVVRAFGRIEPVPHHRGLVADRVHSRQYAVEHLAVPDVARHRLVSVHSGRQPGRAVCLRQQHVQQQHGMAGRHQAVGDVRTDESRATGDQHSHQPTVAAPPRAA